MDEWSDIVYDRELKALTQNTCDGSIFVDVRVIELRKSDGFNVV